MKDTVIGSWKPKGVSKWKPKGVSKSPCERRIRKMAKDVQGKQMGQGCPRRNKWDKEAHEQCNKEAQNSMSMNPMTILSQ